jgi:peptidoglycan/xylan/chitin deacetylase (PgdA/CDA1 family)
MPVHNTPPEQRGAGAPNSVLILVYHSVTTQADPRYKPFTIAPDALAELLGYLGAEGYRGITISEMLARWPGPAEKRIAITFDDGLQDFYTSALPVLHASGFPATLYVVSGQIGGTSGWLASVGEGARPMMSWAQIREAAGLGIEIGAHGLTHHALDTLRAKDAAREIGESRAILEDGLGAPVRTFAYPYGYHGPAVRQQVIDAGYTGAVAVKNKRCMVPGDPYACARMTVYHAHTRADLTRWLSPGGLPIDSGREAPQTRLWRVYRRVRHGLL